MNQQLEYVNYYCRALLGCAFQGMAPTAEETLAVPEGMGWLFTPALDGGGEQATYNRLILEGSFGDARLEVVAAASDAREFWIDGRLCGLDHYLAAPDVPPRSKLEALLALPHVRRVSTTDLLLHELEGRYLWIGVVLVPGETPCELRGMRLELPRCTFTDYFPEVYQGNAFFDRYVAVFQSMLLDEERQVDAIPALLDYESAPDAQLRELAEWLGVEDGEELFTPNQLREIIRNIDLFQGGKGTRRTLTALLELVCGVRPRIVERFQWDTPRLSPEQKRQNERLYGETGDHFCVLLDMTRRGKLPLAEQALERLIGRYSLLGSRAKVVLLRRCSHTDTHCYLDVNCALSVPEVAGVDSGELGAHITIG